jgi:hypothetical protein
MTVLAQMLIYELCTPGLEHGHACLGTGPLRIVADHLCASVRIYLCDDGSSSAFIIHTHLIIMLRQSEVIYHFVDLA